MSRVGMTLAGPEVARVGTENHRSLFWAMGMAQKVKIGHFMVRQERGVAAIKVAAAGKGVAGIKAVAAGKGI